VKVDISADADPRTYAQRAREAEADGYDGLWLGETAHDPLIGCPLVADRIISLSLTWG
jgi:alkanesulfonate monooxygenase SsuD/methylene tetrahydromethanopterin reductase-like flavin-dependent oxidoreductase (luciferase family)